MGARLRGCVVTLPNWYRYARRSFDVAGWTFFADVYCAECGDQLPEVDPEGNDRHPIFVDQVDDLNADGPYHCADCGGVIR